MKLESLDLSDQDENFYKRQLLLYPYKTKFDTVREIKFKLDHNIKIEIDILDNFTHIVLILPLF